MNQGSFRLLYASYHCLMDPCSSVGVNARDLLTLLHGRGWQCRAYTGPDLAFEDGLSLQTLLNDQRYRVFLGPEGKVVPCEGGPARCSLVYLNVGGVPVSIFEAAGSRPSQPPGRSEGYLFLAHLERTLAEFQPDILLTHGDHWLTAEIMAAGRRRKIPVVFWIEQLYYQQGDLLRHAKGLLTPSAWAQQGVRDSLGLESQALPPPLDEGRCVSSQINGQYVTFVNPCPDKGVFFFAGIVRALRELRPQIPFLVVEGRGRQAWLREAGLDLNRLGNVFGMTATNDPRAFYGMSRLVVMPSLREEIFGRVAAESLANGIPVLGSRRGALSEVLAQAGILFDMPASHTPQTRTPPTAEEVAPWVDTILRLWDDPKLYGRERERCLAAAQVWRSERLAPRYSEMLSKIALAAGRLPRAEVPSERDAVAEGGGWVVEQRPSVAAAPAPARPIAAAGPRASGRRRLLFSSYHCLLDPSSGAAHSARDLLTLLGNKGWECRIFSGSQLDFEDGRTFQHLLSDPAFRSRLSVLAARPGSDMAVPYTLYDFMQSGVPATVFDTPGTRPYQPPTAEEGAAYVAQFQQALDEFRPDVMITYGSYPCSAEAMARARLRGAALVFWLRNCAYSYADLFRQVSGILVPSRFSEEYYREKLGINCTPIPSPFAWPRIQCPEVQGKYVTFVNPQSNKGVFVFARIAEEMFRRRPDIPFLVVEGRGNAGWLKRAGLDLDRLKNIFGMAHTPEPRSFYRVSKLVLVPSLWNDTFPRVAAEAMLNGIPVLGTRRGGLPEMLEKAGFLFDVPEKYTPETTLVPTAEEVAPWIDTIIRLWDDRPFFERERQKCRAAAEAWRPEKLAARYDAFLQSLVRA